MLAASIEAQVGARLPGTRRLQAREKAKAVHVYRGTEDPNLVFIHLEFDSEEDAREARQRILESGVLDRFEDKHGPNVVVDADS